MIDTRERIFVQVFVSSERNQENDLCPLATQESVTRDLIAGVDGDDAPTEGSLSLAFRNLVTKEHIQVFRRDNINYLVPTMKGMSHYGGHVASYRHRAKKTTGQASEAA